MIKDVLRGNLQFDGVVITDDMTMGGITKNYDIGKAAIQSVRAGTDIVLVGHNYNQQIAVLQALKRSVDEGQLTEQMLDEHVYRILKLKSKYKLKDTATGSMDVQAINKEISSALAD
ncbi:putative lipoprotein YbbD precursor [compost metagenome]